MKGWENERWIRYGANPKGSRAYLTSRFEKCRAMGAQAIELDNLDGAPIKGSGVRDTDTQQLIQASAELCKQFKMKCGFKNSIEYLSKYKNKFDFLMQEQPDPEGGKKVGHNELPDFVKAAPKMPILSVSYAKGSRARTKGAHQVFLSSKIMDDAVGAVQRQCRNSGAVATTKKSTATVARR
jgi:hypothetical protein